MAIVPLDSGGVLYCPELVSLETTISLSFSAHGSTAPHTLTPMILPPTLHSVIAHQPYILLVFEITGIQTKKTHRHRVAQYVHSSIFPSETGIKHKLDTSVIGLHAASHGDPTYKKPCPRENPGYRSHHQKRLILWLMGPAILPTPWSVLWNYQAQTKPKARSRCYRRRHKKVRIKSCDPRRARKRKYHGWHPNRCAQLSYVIPGEI